MWEYLAGLFDGDGSVSISLHANKSIRSSSISIKAIITTSDPEPLQPILDFLEEQGCISGTYSQINTTTNKLSTGPIYNLQIQNSDGVKKFLLNIQPHLLFKSKHCKIALEAIEQKQKFRDDPTTTVLDNLRCFDDLRHELHKLRKKGPKTLKSWNRVYTQLH